MNKIIYLLSFLLISCASNLKKTNKELVEDTNLKMSDVGYIFDMKDNSFNEYYGKIQFINALISNQEIIYLRPGETTRPLGSYLSSVLNKYKLNLVKDGKNDKKIWKNHYDKGNVVDLKSVYNDIFQLLKGEENFSESFSAFNSFNSYLYEAIDKYSRLYPIRKVHTEVNNENDVTMNYSFGFNWEYKNKKKGIIEITKSINENGKVILKKGTLVKGVYVDKKLIPFTKSNIIKIRNHFESGVEIVILSVILNDNVDKKVLVHKKLIEKKLHYVELRKNGTLYIKINEFSHLDQAKDLRLKIVKNLFASKNILIDLSDNPGGSIETAGLITEFFSREGDILYSYKRLFSDVRHPENVETVLSTYAHNPLDIKVPIYVLINKDSASASEMLALSLKENNRAIILGEKSFGKGIGQSSVSQFENFNYLKKNDDMVLYITNLLVAGPSGKSIHKVGVIPSVSENDKCWQITNKDLLSRAFNYIKCKKQLEKI